jgi:hypothetical protein
MTERSEAIANAEDIATQCLWRSVRGKLLARAGRHAEAEALAQEVVAIIGRAQDPDSQGYAALDLAEVLAMGGHTEAAVTSAEDAAARFQRKGKMASAVRARGLAASEAPREDRRPLIAGATTQEPGTTEATPTFLSLAVALQLPDARITDAEVVGDLVLERRPDAVGERLGRAIRAHQGATEEGDLAGDGSVARPVHGTRDALVEPEQAARTDAGQLRRVGLILDDDGDTLQRLTVRLR